MLYAVLGVIVLILLIVGNNVWSVVQGFGWPALLACGSRRRFSLAEFGMAVVAAAIAVVSLWTVDGVRAIPSRNA